MSDRSARGLVDRGAHVLLASLALYAATASRYILDGDNAELASLGALGGTAHPSGYPASVLWLRATAWLPGASAAHTAALGTALLAAGAAWIAYLACRAWGARALAATVAAGLYATAPVTLRLATEAEVFAGNQLVVALVLWLAAAAGPLRGGGRVVALALVAGLGLANHMTCVLLAPVGLLGAARGLREAARPWPVVAAAGLAALALGLAPYLYLFVAPDTAASWGHVDSWSALRAHVLREDFGGPGSLSAHGQAAAAIDAQLGALLAGLGRAWWWAPLALGLGALAVRAARPAAAGEPRAGWRALAASWLLAGPLLVTRFDIGLAGAERFVAERFYLLPALLLAPAVACGLDALLARAQVGAAAWALGGTALVTSAAVALPPLAAHHSPAGETALRDLLGSLPPDAVVITTGTGAHFGLAYLQLVEGVRPDVLAVTWSMVPLPWYRERLARRGFTLTAGEGAASVRAVTAQLAAGRAVFVDEYEGNVLKALPSYPYGAVFRVLPAGTPALTPRELFAREAALFDGWDRDGAHDYAPPPLDGELGGVMHARYLEVWLGIARALAAAHDAEGEQRALAYASRFGPTA